MRCQWKSCEADPCPRAMGDYARDLSEAGERLAKADDEWRRAKERLRSAESELKSANEYFRLTRHLAEKAIAEHPGQVAGQ